MKLNKHKLGHNIHALINPHMSITLMIALDIFQIAFSHKLNFQRIYFRVAYSQEDFMHKSCSQGSKETKELHDKHTKLQKGKGLRGLPVPNSLLFSLPAITSHQLLSWTVFPTSLSAGLLPHRLTADTERRVTSLSRLMKSPTFTPDNVRFLHCRVDVEINLR